LLLDDDGAAGCKLRSRRPLGGASSRPARPVQITKKISLSLNYLIYSANQIMYKLIK
jgi:hypothetical protein